MKTVKRVFAIAVAVLLIAMMIPTAFAGTATDPNVINWSCTKEGKTLKGYEYTVYQVADYNATTGAFTLAQGASDITQKDINDAVTEDEMNALANKCKTATLPTEGTTFNTTDVSGNFHLADGIYYIKCTTPGPNNKAITKESIVVFPNAGGTTSEDINFGDKVNEGEPEVHKYFLVDGSRTQDDQSFGTVDTTEDGGSLTKTITYVLTADIAGSTTSKLTSYVITDKMGTGLKSITESNISSVVLQPAAGNATTLVKGTDWTFATDAATIDCSTTVNGGTGTTGNTFGIALTNNILSKDSFYTEGNKVVVTFTTELDKAAADVATDIPNTDALIYGNTSGKNVKPGDTVNVKTYQIQALKKDAATHAALTGKTATFGLYEDETCEIQIASATTNASTGYALFDVKLAAGTYYVKETAAPEGYNLNTDVQTVTVGGTTGTATAEVEDTAAKLPSTGGAGTLVFTIVGGSLVLLAAALFVIVMKKRSSAK